MASETSKRARKNIVKKLVYVNKRVNLLERVYANYQGLYGDLNESSIDKRSYQEYRMVVENLPKARESKKKLEAFVVNGFKLSIER